MHRGIRKSPKTAKWLISPTALIICGPTAVGKSDFAVALALKMQKLYGVTCEIVSADSRQVYKGLDVGSGKITKKEMLGVPHHMLDIADPRRMLYSAGKFAHDGALAVRGILERGHFPIIVGGSGFYIEALENELLGKVPLPEVPKNAKLRAELAKLPVTELAARLATLDPRRHAEIDKQNPVRLIRAIEIASVLGKVPERSSVEISPGTLPPTFHFIKIGLDTDDATLRSRIDKRLARRMPGIIKEVRKLRAMPQPISWKRLDELGLEYRHAAQFLKLKPTEQSAEARTKMTLELAMAIWHFAKRQRTWFKRDKAIRWIKH